MSLFRTVYEDDYIIVVTKPPGLLSVPSNRGGESSLIGYIERYLNGQAGHRVNKPFVIHRLDRDTSGLIVFAKDPDSGFAICKQFSSRKSERYYLALVDGVPPNNEGVMRSYLSTNKSLNRFSSKTAKLGHELAITHYRVINKFKTAALVELSLETGRRNQIRIQLHDLGYPVLGDKRYGFKDKDRRRAAWNYKRMALHAATLAFAHPHTGKELLFRDGLPKEFREFIKQQNRDRDDVPEEERDEYQKKPQKIAKEAPAPIAAKKEHKQKPTFQHKNPIHPNHPGARALQQGNAKPAPTERDPKRKRPRHKPRPHHANPKK